MNRLSVAVLVGVAFALGFLVARIPDRAVADPPPVVATSIDLNALAPADLPSPTAALPNLRTKVLALVDQTQFAYSVGIAPKHTHADTTEVQLVLGGSGTEWLGDKAVALAPGTFLVIPPNTPHGGLVGGPFRLFTVKTPPQQAGDYHPVP